MKHWFWRIRRDLRWRVFGYRWFERSPLFCLMHPFQAASEMRRVEQNANIYQGHLVASWAQHGKIVGRDAMDKELGIRW